VDRTLPAGISVFRWLAWAWMATVLFFDRGGLVRPWLAALLVALALAVTVVDSVLLARSPELLFRPGPIAAEVACGCALFLGGGLAFAHGTAFASSQSLAVAWPLAGVLAAGAAGGAAVGAATGVLVGLARMGGALLNRVRPGDLFAGGHLVGTLTPIVLFAMAGGALGYLATLLRKAETEVADARAREEVARTLHDGVLQTLAVVERRSQDPALAGMAREQQRELRAYLAGPVPTTGRRGPDTAPDLLERLEESAATFERRFGGRVDVVAMDDLPQLPPEVGSALAGAVGEALTNAGKHGGASRVTVFVEPDEGPTPRGFPPTRLFCSVKDDGRGFDPAVQPEGLGLSRSIRGRITEVGGRVEVSGQLGAGAEVRLWV
jgi:signal transduction histidine kinase